MMVEKIVVGPLPTNCYLFGDVSSQELILIDAELGVWKKLALLLDQLGLPKRSIKLIVATHAHFDHVRGVAKVRENTGAVFVASENAGETLKGKFGLKIDRCISDEDELIVGNYNLRVSHTPGHSPGSVCLYEENEELLFSGDLIFENGVGRTDLSGGNREQLRNSLRKINILPYSTRVFPGHGRGFVLGDFPFDFQI